MEARTITKDSTLDSLMADPEFSGLFEEIREIPGAPATPSSLVGYQLAKKDDNCGSVCGCNAKNRVGCEEGQNGTNDQGGNCPSGKGDCDSGIG